MTPEELDEARGAEASRRSPDIYGFRQQLVLAARLAREGWQPPEPVDPDLLAAREWIKSDIYGASNESVDAGTWDSHPATRAYLAGCTRGREGAKGLVEALEEAYRALSVDSLPALSRISRALDALASAKRGG